MQKLTTFPRRSEYERAKACLDAQGLPYVLVSPDPGYERVGVPSLALEADGQAALLKEGGLAVGISGWVDYRAAKIQAPSDEPQAFDEDIFGECAIMVLAPCVADETKIRLIAHLGGNLTDVMPYLNAEMAQACYNRHSSTLTFQDSYRMISLYAHRVTIAKADEIVDAWRVLEKIRHQVNDVWMRRDGITPSYDMRKKPPALEIYKRLPGTNCRQCGEKTCMAFALRLWQGELSPKGCAPVFDGEHRHLQEPLLQICEGLGVS